VGLEYVTSSLTGYLNGHLMVISLIKPTLLLLIALK